MPLYPIVYGITKYPAKAGRNISIPKIHSCLWTPKICVHRHHDINTVNWKLIVECVHICWCVCTNAEYNSQFKLQHWYLLMWDNVKPVWIRFCVLFYSFILFIHKQGYGSTCLKCTFSKEIHLALFVNLIF